MEASLRVQCECGTMVSMNVYYQEGEQPKPPENFKCAFCEAEELLSHDIRPESKRRFKRKDAG